MLNLKTINEWIKEYPILNEVIQTNEVFWENPHYQSFYEAIKNISLTEEDCIDALNRLKRFRPYIKKAFDNVKDGIIESPLTLIPNMKKALEKRFNKLLMGDLLLKCDNDLPISGSIKARGGIYEVLKYAEDLAIKEGLLTIECDYSIIDSERFSKFYSKYRISVGSTGNLGLSIGIMSAKLGFQVFIHMSSDAKEWKKELLRSKEVIVIEYDADYSLAVSEGRKQAEEDPYMYFIDDENSKNLFLGYATSAYYLKKQLEEMNIVVNEEQPLFVYLPCGVGGGPGGVTFGLKLLFKDNVHCYFAEPTHSPCMLIGMMTDMHELISVQDFGLDNKTIADGLSVGRPSGFVGKTLKNLISGIYTISDECLLNFLRDLFDTESIKLEPSALAGFLGAILNNDKKGTHIIWATGGGMVPENVMNEYLNKKCRNV